MSVNLRAGVAGLALAGVLVAGCSRSNDPGPGTGAAADGAGPGSSQSSVAVTGPARSGSAAGTSPGAAGSGSPGVSSAPRQPGGQASGPSGKAGPPGGATGKLPRMPNVVGRNMQDAQEALHAAGIVFFATSQDATGRNRPHGLDLFWKVCSQTPRAGQPVPKGVVPNFSVVQTNEKCP